MVGFCGVVGKFDRGLDTVTDTVVWSESEHDSRYVEDGIEIYVSLHQSTETTSQPATTTDGRRVWVWGDVIGYENSAGYELRPFDGETDAEYCRRLLDSHGIEFVDGLNSEFAGVVIDDESDNIIIFTDRLGARPVYYADLDGTLIFGTHPNVVLAHPAIDPTMNDALLVEYLAFERVFGTETPFETVSKLHPGSRLTFDLRSGSTTVETYWRPEYDPIDWRYDELVAEFIDIYSSAVAERAADAADAGVLISGGSDSRLLLSELGADTTGFHMNERMNTEAKTAKRVCDTVGADFRFLERRTDYQTLVLDRISPYLLFTSFFDQAHAVGFDAVLRSEVDELFCGQYSDTLLSRHYAPTATVRIPMLSWDVPVPRAQTPSTVNDYIDYVFADHTFTRGLGDPTPDFVLYHSDAISIFRRHVQKEANRVIHHGVTYPSLESLGVAGGFYPLTNAPTYLFYYSLNQIAPTHYPFLDNRIVDLALSMPRKYLLRRNLVNASLKRTAPDLAAVPHAETRLPLSYPSIAHTGVDLLNELASKLGISIGDDGGAWSDHNRVLRESALVPEHLLDGDKFDCWDGIDPDCVRTLYDRHLDGEDQYFELYGLLSLCNTYPFDESAVDGQ